MLSNETFDSIAKEYGCSDGLCEIAMAELEEGPWKTMSTPVINVVMALRCKFIMISCTLDPANTGPSKWHQLLRSKQARARAGLLPRCHQNTLQKLLLLTTPHCTNRPTAQSVLNVGKQELCIAEDNCQKTTVAMLLSQFDYTCGSHITPPSHSLHGVVVVRMDINCSSPIEAPFYSCALRLGTYDFTHYCGADGAEAGGMAM